MVPLAGFEPAPNSLEDRCNIHFATKVTVYLFFLIKSKIYEMAVSRLI